MFPRALHLRRVVTTGPRTDLCNLHAWTKSPLPSCTANRWHESCSKAVFGHAAAPRHSGHPPPSLDLPRGPLARHRSGEKCDSQTGRAAPLHVDNVGIVPQQRSRERRTAPPTARRNLRVLPHSASATTSSNSHPVQKRATHVRCAQRAGNPRRITADYPESASAAIRAPTTRPGHVSTVCAVHKDPLIRRSRRRPRCRTQAQTTLTLTATHNAHDTQSKPAVAQHLDVAPFTRISGIEQPSPLRASSYERVPIPNNQTDRGHTECAAESLLARLRDRRNQQRRSRQQHPDT